MDVQVNMIVQIEDYERKSEKTVDRMMCGAIIKTNIWIIVHMLIEWKANGESPGKEFIMKKTYKIEVDCANCANKMEEAAKATAGVKDATVNFMTLKMNVEFEEGTDAKAVMQDVLKNCKKVEDDCEIYI